MSGTRVKCILWQYDTLYKKIGESLQGESDRMNIRKSTVNDLSRIAEIFIFNNRINYFPIFKDEHYSFGELQVVSFHI